MMLESGKFLNTALIHSTRLEYMWHFLKTLTRAKHINGGIWKTLAIK